MKIYVHSASHTNDETAIQVHFDNNSVVEFSNNGGSWQVREPRSHTYEDNTSIPPIPFWELAAERVGA